MSGPDPPAPSPKSRRWRRIAIIVVAGILGLLLIGGLVARFGANTSIGRSMIAAQLEGLKVGRFGRLHLEGLSGDVWGDVTVSRMAIVDRRGVWLDAREVQFRWRPLDLVLRRVHLTEITASQVQLVRKPVLEPQGPRGRQPVAVTIDRIGFHLETLPAASGTPGSFDVGASIDSEQNGALSGALDAKSRLHTGDGVSTRFDFGVHQRLALNVQAREGQGGAVAGLLGLPADRPFSLDASADGANGEGWLHLRAVSGDQSIAQADGTWTRQGGQAQGRWSLAASRLSAPMMRAFGPEVRFSAAGRPAGEGLYGVALLAHTDNAAVRAVGLADPVTLRSQTGITVEAAINDLRRFVAAPAMGHAALTGRLVGEWADARISGTVSVEQLSLGGYGLARVAGPIDLAHERGAWRLRIDANGEGGRGAGLLAALIGGRPHATLDATRLDDGRLLIQSLKAEGSGLSLDATGERGLLGDLSFKGDLRVLNLAAARAGASGVIDAQWSGREPKGARAWTINLDAKGARFASGLAELDRLIGPSPRLTGDATYVDGALLIGKAELAGLASDVHAAGPIAKDGGLKLVLGWTANGPFTVGPLDVAGSAKGSGAVTGSLVDPRADLIADFERIDLPDLALKPAHAVLSFVRDSGGIHGDIALTAASDYGPAHAKADFHFVQGGMALTGIDAAGGGVTASGALTLTRSTPSMADLTLSAGPGAFLVQGHADAQLRIVDAPGGPTVSLALKASDASLRNSNVVLTSADISANGPLAHAPYRISGALAWAGMPIRLDGGGVASQTGSAYAVSFEGAGRLRQADFRTIAPVLLTFGGQNASLKASLTLGAGRMDLDAQQTGRQVEATAKLAGVNIAALDSDFAGRVDAELSMTGHDQTVSGTLDARLADARLSDAQAKLALSGDLKASLAGDRMDIVANAQNQAGGRANITRRCLRQVQPHPSASRSRRRSP